jgi:glutathione synthase/RimK-type ligase-like ATP-grasp enzyme
MKRSTKHTGVLSVANSQLCENRAVRHDGAVSPNTRRLAIFYEHPEWFQPLFAELDRRGVAYDQLLAHQHRFDPAEPRNPYALIVNRMSPSAYLRGHAQAIFYTLHYLAYLKALGATVLNGYDAYVYEFSKARQLGLLHQLGLRYPRARVINDPAQAPMAAEGLTFPVVLKPNIGGSGAKIVKFNAMDELREAVRLGTLDLGLDHTALMQEYLPAEGDSIVRVEMLGGAYLYAIRLFLTVGEFNLCPADYCRVPELPSAARGPANGVSGRQVPVEAYTPPAHIIDAVQQITAAAHIEVGGVEYLVNARDGQAYFYDINALSNFVADAANVVGFNPVPRLVDYLLTRAGVEPGT